MPELPEVETIKLQLNKLLVGHEILGIEVLSEKSFQGNKKLVIGGKVMGLRRFGKALIVDLNNQYSLMIHLKMTGQLIYRGKNLKKIEKSKNVGSLPGKYTRVIIELDQDSKLYFNDLRKFGYVKVLETKSVEDQNFIDSLGPEPFGSAQGKPGRLTQDYFRGKLGQSTQKIKLFLLDQKKVSGIGNIYANDALFLAKIDPQRPANKISEEEAKRLLKAIETVLKRGIKYGGASDNSYVTATGGEGAYQKHFLVYGKANKPCPNKCGEKIKRIALGGRGTFYCPVCQK